MYSALVTKITTRPHGNADNLLLGLCHGHQVVVSKDTTDGELGVFFDSDGKLSHEMLIANGLYNKAACEALGIGSPETAKYGFFSQSGRVRSQNFRGQKSDGFWVPLSYLEWTGYDLALLKDGDTFTSLNDQLVCEKYFTPATLRAMKAGNQKKQPDAIFPKHIDTAQFRYYAESIPADAVIYISEKLHGTSGRLAHTVEFIQPSWFARMRARIAGLAPQTWKWSYLNGSRNVIIEKTDGAGYYGTNDFRYDVVRQVEGLLHKGEILYFEIIGDVAIGSAIMNPQVVDDKGLKKQYGDVMRYTYGTVAGEHKMFVYRISRLNEDGLETDLSWPQVEARCQELGLQFVPLLRKPFVYDGDAETLRLSVESLVDGPSTLDARHIREGVVIRAESNRGIQYLKHKSFAFKYLEGLVKNDEDAIDLEEAA